MVLFQLLLLLSLFCIIFYFCYLKATQHLELLKSTDSRFYDIEDAADLLAKSKKDFYFYFMFLYVHSPIYVANAGTRLPHIEKRIRKYLRVIWGSLAAIVLLSAIDYLRQAF
jgi:hypothetical protein